MNCSGGSRRAIRRSSHARSALASTCPALYQWRLLAFTLPTTTLLRSTDGGPDVGGRQPERGAPPGPHAREAHDPAWRDGPG